MPAPIESSLYRRSSFCTSVKQEVPIDFYDFHTTCYSSVDDFIVQDYYPHELEAAFCRDFSCCGLILDDLHDLLQHYEECHVRLDIEEEDSQLSFYHDEWSSDSSVPSSPATPSKPSPVLANGTNATKKKATAAFSDIYSEDMGISLNDSSAFDTSVLRLSPKADDNPKKRSRADSTLETMAPNPKKVAFTTNAVTNVVNPTTTSSKDGSLKNTKETFSPFAVVPTSPVQKPYKCPVPGCDKAYKNPNGLKYHNQHGHCNAQSGSEADKVNLKPYQCTIGDCRKRYKNLNGLKYHIQHAHMTITNGPYTDTVPSFPTTISPANSPVPSPYILPLTSVLN